MQYSKIIKTLKEYSGESFTDTISKDGNELITENETATYTLYDSLGAVDGATGALTISSDKRSMLLSVPNTDTSGLIGAHKILVELNDSLDSTVSDIIAEYNIEYLSRKA